MYAFSIAVALQVSLTTETALFARSKSMQALASTQIGAMKIGILLDWHLVCFRVDCHYQR